jgi:hypothetical protein
MPPLEQPVRTATAETTTDRRTRPGARLEGLIGIPNDVLFPRHGSCADTTAFPPQWQNLLAPPEELLKKEKTSVSRRTARVAYLLDFVLAKRASSQSF